MDKRINVLDALSEHGFICSPNDPIEVIEQTISWIKWPRVQGMFIPLTEISPGVFVTYRRFVIKWLYLYEISKCGCKSYGSAKTRTTGSRTRRTRITVFIATVTVLLKFCVVLNPLHHKVQNVNAQVQNVVWITAHVLSLTETKNKLNKTLGNKSRSRIFY